MFIVLLHKIACDELFMHIFIVECKCVPASWIKSMDFYYEFKKEISYKSTNVTNQ